MTTTQKIKNYFEAMMTSGEHRGPGEGELIICQQCGTRLLAATGRKEIDGIVWCYACWMRRPSNLEA